jgi:hypothetical protein
MPARRCSPCPEARGAIARWISSTFDDRGRVLRNEGGNASHWIELRLTGRRSKRDGIGAEVQLTTASGAIRHATARTAGDYLSAGDRRVHLGLGLKREIRSIEVRWPSGTVQRLTDVAPDQILTVAEPGTDLPGSRPPRPVTRAGVSLPRDSRPRP